MTCKVLLLEEDASSAAELQAGLQELGCEVTLIVDNDSFGGGRVMASVAAEPFDLILLSVDPPLMSGLGICERVRRDPRGRSVPIVLMSVDIEAVAAREPSPSRADGYLRKPVGPRELVAEIRTRLPSLGAGADSHTRLAVDSSQDAVGDVPVEWETDDDAPPEVAAGPDAVDNGLRPPLHEAKANPEGMATQLEAERRAQREALARAEADLAVAVAERASAVERADDLARRADRAETGRQAAITVAVADATRAVREELDARLASKQKEHALAIERLTANLKQERAVRAGLESLRDGDLAELAATHAERQTAEAGLAELRAVHAAELTRLRESHERALAEAREEASDQLAVEIQAGNEASARSLEEVRSFAQKELEETLAAANLAKIEELADERLRARSLLASVQADWTARHLEATGKRDQEAARASDLERELQLSRAAVLDLVHQEEQLRSELATQQKEHEAALAGAALESRSRLREADELLATERATAAASLASAETERANERLQLLRSHEQGLTQARQEHEQALATAVAAASRALREEGDAALASAANDHRAVTDRLSVALDEERAALAHERAARAQVESSHADAVGELAREREGRRVAEETMEALRVAQAAELSRLDDSLGQMLELERASASAALAETRAAALQAIALGVADAQRIAQSELEQALAARDSAKNEELAEERSRAQSMLASAVAEQDARRTEVLGELDREATRARDLDLAVRGAQKARDELVLEQERLLSELELRRKEHEAAALAGAARSREADERLASERAAGAALLASAKANFDSENAALVANRDQEARRASELDEALRASQAARDELIREHDQLRGELEAHRSEHEAAAQIAQDRLRAADERLARELSAAASSHASAQARFDRENAAIHADRDQEAAQARELDALLRASQTAHDELVSEHARLQSELEAHRREHETAAVTAQASLRGADERLAAEREAATSTLASAQAKFDREKAAIDADRDQEAARARELDALLAASRTAHEELASEHARLRNGLETHRREQETAALAAQASLRAAEERLAAEREAAASSLASAQAKFDGENAAIHADRDQEAARARELDALLGASRTAHDELAGAQARLRIELEAGRSKHEAAALSARDSLRAADERLATERSDAASSLASALAAAQAAFDAEKAAILASRDEAVARARGLDVALRASQAAHHDLVRDRERLLGELDTQHKEHEAAAATAEARAREADGTIAAERAAAAAEATRVGELGLALRTSQAAEGDLQRAQQGLLAEAEARRTEYEAAAAALEGRLREATESLAQARSSASASLSSAEARFDAERAAVIADRDKQVTRVGELEEALLRADAAREDLAREQARLRGELERHESAVAVATDHLRIANDGFAAERGALASSLTAAEAQFAAERAALLAERDHEAFRASTLEEALHGSRTAREDLTSEQTRLLAELEAGRKKLDAALAGARDRVRELDDELARERSTAASSLAAAHASFDAERAEIVANRREEAERSRALEEEIRGARAAHGEMVTELARLQGEAETHRSDHEAAAEALRSRLRLADERLAEEASRAASARTSAEAAFAARHLKAEDDLEDERAKAMAAARSAEALARAHAEAIAEIQSTYEHAVSELRLELIEREKALSSASELRVSSLEATHEERVAALRKELGAALGALSAERQRRVRDGAEVNGPAEPKRPSAERRAVKPEDLREEAVTMAAHTMLDPMADTPGHPMDPRGVLRMVLSRALLGDAHADLAMDALLVAARRKQLPVESNDLLALVERHMLADLREKIGQAQAHALMDDLAERLTGPAARDRPPNAEVAHRRTTQPPPVEKGPSLKRTARPMPPTETARPPRMSSRRTVLVIDRDRMTRANLSRALARAGCEITVRDSCVGIASGVDEFDVIVTEVVDVAIEALLETFTREPPECAIVAWTAGVEGARTMFTSAGIGGVSVVLKESRPDALVAAVRANLGDLPGIARG